MLPNSWYKLSTLKAEDKEGKGGTCVLSNLVWIKEGDEIRKVSHLLKWQPFTFFLKKTFPLKEIVNFSHSKIYFTIFK